MKSQAYDLIHIHPGWEGEPLRAEGAHTGCDYCANSDQDIAPENLLEALRAAQAVHEERARHYQRMGELVATHGPEGVNAALVRVGLASQAANDLDYAVRTERGEDAGTYGQDMLAVGIPSLTAVFEAARAQITEVDLEIARGLGKEPRYLELFQAA